MELCSDRPDREGIFAGKHALVVGGSGGIGKAVALGIAKRGASVTITGGNSAKRLEDTLAELNVISRISRRDAENAKEGKDYNNVEISRHSGFLCKIGLSGGGLSTEKAASFILEKAPPPDILVVSWGPFKRIALQEMTPEKWRFYVENNLIFPGIITSLALNTMIDRGWGRILLFGGTKTEDLRGFSDNAAYGAAKTALGSLAKSVVKSAGRAGVCCNVICPGLTATEYTTPSECSWYSEKVPGGRVLSADNIADCALDVLQTPNLNGAIIPVDGGIWV